MERRELDTEEVVDIYDELLGTYRREWEYRGHRSLHLAYYDEEHDEPGSAAINTMRVLSEAADVTGDDRILNIGCGAGEDSVWNARAYDATVVGVNISETQLELARENAREHDVDDLTTFRNDDFHELATVDDDSIDLVWGLEAVSHSGDRPRVLDQCQRVLAPDGRVAFTDLFVRSPEVPESEEDDIRAIDDALGVRLGPIGAFEDALGECGFENVAVEELTDGIRQCTERRNSFARIAHPVGRVLSKLGVVSPTQVGAFRANRLIHRLVESGTLGYYLVTADVSAGEQ